MTKKNKRSVRSQRPPYNPLNDMEDNVTIEDKRTDEEASPQAMEAEPNQPMETVVESEVVEEVKTPSEDEVTEENVHDTDLAMDIPNYTLRQVPDGESTRQSRHAAKPHVTTQAPPMFSLKNPIVKYGLMALGVIMVAGIIFGSSKAKTPSSGPVIVDVTETEGERKSVRNSINRVSSPRIVFGDLRKNPSLMVAPPMTPGVSN